MHLFLFFFRLPIKERILGRSADRNSEYHDLGTECINNMKFTELFNIINTRLLNQNNKATKTIISTNLSIQNLFNSYDERIVSRLIGNYNICRFYGEDLRFKLRK